ncbi:hypothetical protein [Ignavibacterium sp.]|uniref:hypothetical protein n=1 Tax=Ignavibacterium sp. TaxID=2651167 RepID=UPI00307F7260
MKAEVEILSTLSNLNCPASRKQLIEVSYKTALTYLKYNFRKVKKILISEELTPQELALDAISSLFESDEEKRFVVIEEAVKRWNPPINSEKEAEFFLNKLIASRIEQHISLLLRQSDPFFSRILDKINYQIKKKVLKKSNFLGNVYILPSQSDKITSGVIKEEDFNAIPLAIFSNRENLFENIFNYLKNETSFAIAIPLNLLIFRLKEVETSLFEVSEVTSDYLEKRNVDLIVESALKITLDKFEKSYIKKGKFDNDDFSLIEKVLKDIAFDLKDGGVSPGLYKYFVVHNSEITHEIYLSRYRNTLEYLFKILKQNIAIELRD